MKEIMLKCLYPQKNNGKHVLVIWVQNQKLPLRNCIGPINLFMSLVVNARAKPTSHVGLARSAKSIEEAFKLFIDDNIIDLIVSKTNKHIDMVISNLPDHISSSDKYPYIERVNDIELRAFLGLMYFRGLLGQNNHRCEFLFCETTGHPVFTATMSKNRMKFLIQNLMFDDRNDRAERWQPDRFAAARAIYTMFNSNCAKYLVPSEYLAIDETLYPMRHQIAFRQYNPNKPAKYGLLFKSINDARFPYTYQSTIYSDKPEQGNGPHYIEGTENHVKY